MLTGAARAARTDSARNGFLQSQSGDELNFKIQGIGSLQGLTLDRLKRRQSLLEQFDRQKGLAERSGRVDSYDKFRQRAFSLVASEKARAAFDICQESDKLRDKYGRNLFGQSTLVARRLIEAGVRFATVHYDAVDGYSWDSHRNSDDVKKHLVPGLDSALSTLIEDLDDRGLLDETLVVCLGEMGRTPISP